MQGVETIGCPACQTPIGVPPNTAPGMVLQCPSCGGAVAIPGGPSGGGGGGPAQQQMKDPLCNLPSVWCTQKMSDTEVYTGGCFEKRNKYKIYADGKGKVYKAKEESDCCQRMCCAPDHSLTVNIKEDEDGFESYRMEKDFALSGCFALCGICQPEAKVYKSSDGTLVGRAKRPTCGGGVAPVVELFDKDDQKFGELKGPTLCIGALCSSNFEYTNTSGEITGRIKNEKGEKGLCAACCTDADDFQLVFDPAMNENQRATMIGTMLLLDFMHFEDDGACQRKGNYCALKCCDLYCCGCKIPVKCCLPSGGEGGGD